jgi:structural maintenance of chromosome 4
VHSELSEKRNVISQLEAEKSNIQGKLHSARSREAEIRQSLEKESSKSRLVQELMSFSKREKLKGVFGRLGDLGCIDAKYDVAISTSCGALNNFLVDNTETGRRCVTFLRERKLGTATFIMLDKMTQQFERTVRQTFHPPARSERLFDLIDVRDERFLPAFYYAMRDTLVTADMETASSIAFGDSRSSKPKIVTLSGDMIDPSGVMSGGGARKYRGALALRTGSKGSQFSPEFTAEDLKEAQHEVSSLEHDLEASRSSHGKLQREIAELEDSERSLSTHISKLRAGMDSLTKQHGLLQDRLSKAQSENSSSSNELKQVKSLKSQMNSLSKKIASAEEAASELQEEIQALNDQLMDAGGRQLMDAAKLVSDLEAEILSIASNINKNEVEKESSSKQISRLDAAVNKAQEDLTVADIQISDITEELQVLSEEAEELKSAAEQAKSIAKERLQIIEEMKASHDAKKKAHIKLQTVEIELKAKVEDLNGRVSSAAANLQKRQQQVEQILAELRQSEEEIFGSDFAEEIKKIEVEGNYLEGTFEPMAEEELKGYGKEARKKLAFTVTVLDEMLKEMNPNRSAIAEYLQKQQDAKKRQRSLDSCQKHRDAVREHFENLRKCRLDEFMAGFSIITMKLKEMYQMLTLGGDAELELVDALDPFAEGIIFSVRPPKKSWKNISNLSGGEKVTFPFFDSASLNSISDS